MRAVPDAAKQKRETPKIRSSRRKQSKWAQDSVFQLSVDGTIKHQGDAWTKPHELGGEMYSVHEQWDMFKRNNANTKKFGSDLKKRYDPGEMLRNPPLPEDITLEMLMAAQTHMGHNVKKWNPANAKYIYGQREGTHIIALETTAAHLRRAARVVEEVAYHGGIILFVGTRNGQMEIVSRTAQMAGAYQLFTKWAPGTITNRDVMLDGHTTKVVDEVDDQLPDFERYDLKSRPMTPDLVVCLNPQENYTMLYECGLATIPTIGIIDTDTDPTWVTYGIPANDDSLRSVSVISGVLGRAGQRGQTRRKLDSASGRVPWQTSAELQRHIGAERAHAQAQRRRLKAVLAHRQGLNEEELELMEEQEKRQKVPAEVNEDAMLDMLGQAATGEKKTSKKGSSMEKTLEGVDKQLTEQLDRARQLVKDVETVMAAAGAENVTPELQAQLAGAQKMVEDIEADIAETGSQVADSLPPIMEELAEMSPAEKKRKQLEALLGGEKKP